VAALIASKARGMQQRSDGKGGGAMFFCMRRRSGAPAIRFKPRPVPPKRPVRRRAEAAPALTCCLAPDDPAGVIRGVPVRRDRRR